MSTMKSSEVDLAMEGIIAKHAARLEGTRTWDFYKDPLIEAHAALKACLRGRPSGTPVDPSVLEDLVERQNALAIVIDATLGAVLADGSQKPAIVAAAQQVRADVFPKRPSPRRNAHARATEWCALAPVVEQHKVSLRAITAAGGGTLLEKAQGKRPADHTPRLDRAV
jgi:hypothetical protein